MKTFEFIAELKKYNVGPFIEIPCSILSPIITELLQDNPDEVINPVNEAIGMGMAAGSFMATGKTPVLLIQNSGLCNTLNSLTSLHQLYKIPVLYIVSWRGQPGIHDAPEHILLGERLQDLLHSLDIPYIVLSSKNYQNDIKSIIDCITHEQKPGVLILKKGILESPHVPAQQQPHRLTKTDALSAIITAGCSTSYFVATNGFISRETYYVFKKLSLDSVNQPFYMLGSMGHALPIALGMAKYMPESKKIIVFDGDGGCLMHLGSMASVGKQLPSQLIHIVLDNGMYASTGGQSTVSGTVDFCKIAQGCNYRNIFRISDAAHLKQACAHMLEMPGPTFVHLIVTDSIEIPYQRVSDEYSCEQIKTRFMDFIHNDVTERIS